MSRKTIHVDAILKEVNKILAVSTCKADIRQGEINVLEHILHKTGNYNGFCYLYPSQVPANCLPGINDVPNIDTLDSNTRYEKNFENTDRTRCRYF